MVPPSILWGALDPRGHFNRSPVQDWALMGHTYFPMHLPPGSFSFHGHLDSVLTPLFPLPAATPLR